MSTAKKPHGEGGPEIVPGLPSDEDRVQEAVRKILDNTDFDFRRGISFFSPIFPFGEEKAIPEDDISPHVRAYTGHALCNQDILVVELQAQAFIRAGEPERAREVYQAASRKHEEGMERFGLAAEYAEKAGDLERAKLMGELANVMGDSEFEHNVAMAEIYEHAGFPEKARAIYGESSKQAEEDDGFHRAWKYAELAGDTERAEAMRRIAEAMEKPLVAEERDSEHVFFEVDSAETFMERGNYTTEGEIPDGKMRIYTVHTIARNSDCKAGDVQDPENPLSRAIDLDHYEGFKTATILAHSLEEAFQYFIGEDEPHYESPHDMPGVITSVCEKRIKPGVL